MALTKELIQTITALQFLPVGEPLEWWFTKVCLCVKKLDMPLIQNFIPLIDMQRVLNH
jgi:hypothetical protein